jgi:hypothetical protein
LDHWGVHPFVVLGKPGDVGWENYKKITLTAEYAAKQCNAEYILGIDADDALLLAPPGEVLERYSAMTERRIIHVRPLVRPGDPEPAVKVTRFCRPIHHGSQLLFAAERHPHPPGKALRTETQIEISRAEQAGELPYAHLNSGGFIGSREAVAYWFGQAASWPRQQSPKYPGSDQGVWRSRYWDSCGKIQIDRRQELFAVATGRYDPEDAVVMEEGHE